MFSQPMTCLILSTASFPEHIRICFLSLLYFSPLMLFHNSLRLCSFFFSLFSPFLFLVVSTAVSSCFLIFCPKVSNILLTYPVYFSPQMLHFSFLCLSVQRDLTCVSNMLTLSSAFLKRVCFSQQFKCQFILLIVLSTYGSYFFFFFFAYLHVLKYLFGCHTL